VLDQAIVSRPATIANVLALPLISALPGVFLKETSLDVIVVIMGDSGSSNEVKGEFKDEFIALSKPDPEYAAVLFVSNHILGMRI
jgi:hypothetical protein